MNIGEKIRFLRKKFNITQEELATRAEISVFTLRQYESGARSAPRIEQLNKLAKALNVSVDYLVNDHTDEFGLSDEAAYRLRLLCDVSQVPPESGSYSRIALLSDLLENETFDRFLACCAKYVSLLRTEPSLEYSTSADFKFYSDELKKHGYEIALPDEQAEVLFSERIINTLRTCLNEIAESSSVRQADGAAKDKIAAPDQKAGAAEDTV